MRRRFLLGLALVLLAADPARAASFDCGAAQTVREKAICADPALSATDEKLAQAYRAASAPLSPETRRALRDGQRSWLRFVDTLCFSPGRGESSGRCLNGRYVLRLRQLDHATVIGDDRVIARFETFVASPSRDRLKFVERDIAYPQIDRPRRGAERRWNGAIRREIGQIAERDPATPRDEYIDYRIAMTMERLISTVVTYYQYPHGAAHGGETLIAFDWLLDEHRPLDAGDLFDPGKPWQDTLARLAFARLAQQIEPDMLFAKSPDELRDAIAKPERWAIERDGIGVLFQEYEIGPYVIGHPEAVVPWSELQPLLAVRPAFTIPPP
jgi:uncharacterized protein